MIDTKLQSNISGEISGNQRFSMSKNVKQVKNEGIWTTNQQKKYIIFLEMHKHILQSRQKRKDHHIFKKMSLHIHTRDGIQCRSHHMKLLRTHQKIRKIIKYYQKILGLSEAQKLLEVNKCLRSIRTDECNEFDTPLLKKIHKKVGLKRKLRIGKRDKLIENKQSAQPVQHTSPQFQANKAFMHLNWGIYPIYNMLPYQFASYNNIWP